MAALSLRRKSARERFERIAERKLRQRQLTDDGKVEISGRDLREVIAALVLSADNLAAFRTTHS